MIAQKATENLLDASTGRAKLTALLIFFPAKNAENSRERDLHLLENPAAASSVPLCGFEEGASGGLVFFVRQVFSLTLFDNLSSHFPGDRKFFDAHEQFAGLVGFRHILAQRANARNMDIFQFF
jgi:hypothetical protein